MVGLVYKGSRTKAAHIDICRRTKTPDEGTMRRHSKGLNLQLSPSLTDSPFLFLVFTTIELWSPDVSLVGLFGCLDIETTTHVAPF